MITLGEKVVAMSVILTTNVGLAVFGGFIGALAGLLGLLVVGGGLWSVQ
jgi:hypothetical protein